MHTHSMDEFRHAHVFLGAAHERNESRTWGVIAICAAMMVAEIVGGLVFGSVALIADGLHMSTHAGALLIAALAYTYARRHAGDPRLAFGAGKLGDLAAFAQNAFQLVAETDAARGQPDCVALQRIGEVARRPRDCFVRGRDVFRAGAFVARVDRGFELAAQFKPLLEFGERRQLSECRRP